MTQQKNLAIGSKWTASAPLMGWRHFWICGRRYQEDRLMVELMAACDRSVRLEVEAGALTDTTGSTTFVPGWTPGRSL